MAYSTNNPVEPSGSTDPRDLSDNAQIIDKVVNGSELTWIGRLGKVIKTFSGMYDEFTSFLLRSGFESVHVMYAADAIVQRSTQLVERAGELYRVALQADLPLTLTGNWATDSPKLKAAGDSPLRQQLADPSLTSGVTVARAIRHLNGLSELKAAAGRYNGDTASLVSSPGLAGEFVWNASSTATSDDMFVVQVSGQSAGRWLRDLQQFTSSATEITTGIGATALAEVVRMQAMFKAEKIRRAAGAQPWITLGPADPTKVGVTTDARTARAVISITSQAQASALAASGTGTLADPYIIKNWNLTFSSGQPAITMNDPAATYYVRFYNVRPAGTSNGSAAVNVIAFGTPVVFERCGFAGGSGAADETALQISGGRVQYYGCEFSGMSGQIVVGAGLGSKSVEMYDSRVVGTAKASATNGVFWNADPGDLSISIYRCAFTSSHFHWHVGNGWTVDYKMVQDTLISGCAVGIGDLNYQKPGGNILIQIPNMIRNSTFKNVRFTYTPGVTQTAAYGNGADNCLFENCSFEGNIAERRLFEWRRTSNVTLKRCYFNKVTGTNNAGNEVCEFWETAGLTVQECWALGAPEDCFELVSSYGRNKFIDNVGDGVTGQIIDIFGVGAFDVEVNGVYGDCGDAAVLVTDTDYVTISNVFTKQTGTSALGAVVLERRNAAFGASPKGCVVSGFLPLPSVSSRGKPFAVDTRQASQAGGLGSNFATWWEGGVLQTFGAANPERLTLR